MQDMGKWHLDKRVSVGHIITTVTVAAAAAAWFMYTEARIGVLEVRVETVETSVRTNQVATQVQYSEIIRRLERMSDQNQRHLEEHSRERR